MPKRELTLEPRLRIVGTGQPAFGPGKAELLGLIGETGSIRSAATRMSMSYNRAWTLVREMNRMFRMPLVTAVRGGASGGGARLTASGRKVLERYTRMERACQAATRADWRALRRSFLPRR
jgi:molybdate transport system regulatory protein